MAPEQNVRKRHRAAHHWIELPPVMISFDFPAGASGVRVGPSELAVQSIWKLTDAVVAVYVPSSVSDPALGAETKKPESTCAVSSVKDVGVVPISSSATRLQVRPESVETEPLLSAGYRAARSESSGAAGMDRRGQRRRLF